MTRVSRRQLVAGGLTAAVGGLAGCVSGDRDATETFSKTRDADGIERVAVTTTNGAIRGRTERRETVEIGGEKRAAGEEALDDVTIEAVRDGASLSVSASVDRNGVFSALRPAPAVDFDLAIPDSVATIDAKTTNGNVDLQNVAAAVTVETTNGNITVDGITGDTTAESTNGNVTLALAEPGNVEAETTNGSIEIQVPESTPAAFDLESTNGEITVEGLENLSNVQTDGVVTVVNGENTYTVECETTNGDITVRGQS